MAKQYKKPENTKYKTRKDLKDYTMDDKKGTSNPKSSGEKLPNLLRKTDKEVIDDGTYDVKWNADDRLYKDLEDGEYDPKTALKRLKKRQDTDEKLSKDQLKDKIENLTREQKERIVREYVRRKIESILLEQVAPEEEPVAPEEPIAPEPAAEPAAAPAPMPTDPAPMPTDPAAAMPTDTPAEAPVDAAAPTEVPAEAPAEAPAPEAEAEMSPETKEALAVEKFVAHLQKEGGNIARIKTLAKVINQSISEAEPEDKMNFFKLLRQFAIKKISTIE
jgi:hypothetical protein